VQTTEKNILQDFTTNESNKVEFDHLFLGILDMIYNKNIIATVY